MRRSVVVVTVLALWAGALVPATAQEGPPQVPDTIRGYAIMPPGQDGSVTTEEFASGDYGPHFDDQLEPYAALVQDDDVTEEELLDYFHLFQFSPGAEIEREYSPTDGVTVYRDAQGVPHIYGDSVETAAFASGYVTAEDRLFQMDIFRHAAKGELAGFAGPGKNDSLLKRDIATRREGYTEAEVQEMFDTLDDRFGETGAALQAGIQAYSDGVNAYMDEVRLDPTQMPVEYAATGNPQPEYPEAWSPLDTMYIAILQLREFGETAGTELQNAGFFSHLTERHGAKKGRKLYDSLLFQNDPRSPTTIPASEADFSTQDLSGVDWESVAIPDRAEKMARRTAAEQRRNDRILGRLGFRTPASNALLVSADRSATGNPLLLGGPQVGHALPSFFLDIAVHAPGMDFRGPAVPGTSALVPLGRGSDYAWTLTTGYSDAVDVRAELLCEPEGGEPTKDSNHYVFEGECVPMDERTETFQVKPPPTSPGPPREEERTFYRTTHGPVFQRDTVDGKPVAFVKQRFFWMKEVDSLPSFYEWNTNVDSLEDFATAAENFSMSFNSFYADHKHIAYFHVGEYPVRAEGQHPSLPVWGTGEWEWQGRRAYSEQPKIIDPEQGWVANWNNKPAASWDNQDGFKWGPVQRVQLLMDRMEQLFDKGGKAMVSDIVDVVRDAATRDGRAAYLGPVMLRKAAKLKKKQRPEGYDQAMAIVKDWIQRGAHRSNLDRDETMDDGPALALIDEWYDQLVHKVFDDEIGEDGYPMMSDADILDYNPRNGGGFWFDFSSYLTNLLQRKHRRTTFSWNLCDNKDTDGKESCNALVAESLIKAIEKLTKAQGEDMTKWTVPAENISFTGNANSASGGEVDDIPWQNRGSENHIVEVLAPAVR